MLFSLAGSLQPFSAASFCHLCYPLFNGSRVMFTSEIYQAKILLHKPHPRKELLDYQVKQLKEQLEQEGLL